MFNIRMCVYIIYIYIYIYTHNTYAQYTSIYYVKKTLILDVITRLTALIYMFQSNFEEYVNSVFLCISIIYITIPREQIY